MNIILTWSSGSGLLSAGEIVIEWLQNAGYFIVAEREYPSLIKGGCSVFRIEVSVSPVQSISQFADIVVAFDRVGSMNAFPHVRDCGLLIYGDEMHEKVSWFHQEITTKHLTTIFIPEYATPKKFGANELLSNMLMIGALWRALGLDIEVLKEAVKKRFLSKPTLLALDLALIGHGYILQDAIIQNGVRHCEPSEVIDESVAIHGNGSPRHSVPRDDKQELLSESSLPPTNNIQLSTCNTRRLLDWNEILALSAVHHGVRAYFAYPMSPSSTILTHLANWADKTGMHVEQVEDEISVSQMALGASFGGTRSLCATSGGGYDLMTETVSLAGMIETPLTIIVAQRPGPATGLPTWSAQEDINLAIYSGHGEYAKAVIAVWDHEEAFRVLWEALNIAETYQIPVIVLTDKTLAETKTSIHPESLVGVEIERGITWMKNEEEEYLNGIPSRMNNEGLLNNSSVDEKINHWTLSPSSRYELTESGLSPRWLPGTGPRYYANGDEHGPDGTLREDAIGVQEAHEKRIRKMRTLENNTPEPVLFWNPDAKITLVWFWSTKMEVMDFVEELNVRCWTWDVEPEKVSQTLNIKHLTFNNINYLHYTHIWPLKTETLKKLSKKNKIIVVEHNMTGQFASLLRGAGVRVDEQWNKYDGRRFYREEMSEKIRLLVDQKKGVLNYLKNIFQKSHWKK